MGIFQKKNPKIFENTFFEKKIHLEKKSRNFSEHLCQLRIFPGFQKSYLEQRAVRLKSRKTRDPVFSEFPDPGIVRYSVTYYKSVFLNSYILEHGIGIFEMLCFP